MPVVRPCRPLLVTSCPAGWRPTRWPRRRWPDVDTGTTVRVVRVRPARAPRTVHPHSAEILYILPAPGPPGRATRRHPVGAGDVVVVPTGVPHATVAAGPEGLVLVCFFPHPDLAANTEDLPGPERT